MSKKLDFAQVAFRVAQQATHTADQPTPEPPPIPEDVRRRIMADFARSGGLKGGPARAASMTPAKRKEIAQKAAAARWKDGKPS